MTTASHPTFPKSFALAALMATGAMNTNTHLKLTVSDSPRPRRSPRMPKRRPNHPRLRFVAQAYSRNFSVNTTTFSQRRQTRFRVGELMKLNFPKPVFAVDGLLPAGLIMLAGAPKVGKSFLILDLAVCVAGGLPFLGRATAQGDVLYLALEDNGARLVDRLEKITAYAELGGLPLELWTEISRADNGGIQALKDWLKAAENPKLIIVDVWGKFSPEEAGGSKDAYIQITQALQPLQALAQQYDLTICLVHHTRKVSGDGATSNDMFDQILGSRALTSNMDATTMLTRTRMTSDATLSITGRDIEEEQFNLNFDRTTFRWNEVGRTLTPSLSPERQKVFDAIAAGCTKTADIVSYVGKGRTAVANLLKVLCEDGVIESPSKGIYHLPGQPAPDPETELPGDMNVLDDIAEPDLTDLI